MYLKIKIVLITLCISVFGFAQDLEKDLEAIGKEMSVVSSVDINVKVNVFSKKGGSSVYSAPASLQKMGKFSRSVLGEIEYTRLKNCEVRMDHDERTAFYVETDSTQSDSYGSNFNLDVKALKQIVKSQGDTPKPEVELRSETNGVRKYVVTGIHGVKEIIMVLDLNRKVIKSVSYEYTSSEMGGQYVLLEYTKFEYNKNLKSTFLTSNYIKQDNEQIVLVDKYKDYTLITE